MRNLATRLDRLATVWPAPLPPPLVALAEAGAALLGLDPGLVVAQAATDLAVARAAGDITEVEIAADAAHVARLDEAAQRAWLTAALRERGVLP